MLSLNQLSIRRLLPEVEIDSCLPAAISSPTTPVERV